MCVASMIYDHYGDKWQRYMDDWIKVHPFAPDPRPYIRPITPEEIEEFRKLLEQARKYDEENNQKGCELEEKKEKLRKLAEELGATVDFLQ